LKTKRIFVRYVSHEIRTPLNTTILGLKCLESDVKQYLTEDQWNSIEDIFEDVKDACGTAVDILNDLLLYEKLDDGIFGLNLSLHPLRQILDDAFRFFRVAARSTFVSFVEDISILNEKACIYADESKFQQVLRNLLSNALKFTPKQGTVKVHVQLFPWKELDQHNEGIVFASSMISSSHGQQSFTTTAETTAVNGEDERTIQQPQKHSPRDSDTILPNPLPDTFARISVIDTGCGISDVDQVNLFHEFIQVKADKLQSGQGSGLGLWSKFIHF
jgi:signal transduction histidine kinase